MKGGGYKRKFTEERKTSLATSGMLFSCRLHCWVEVSNIRINLPSADSR